MATDPNRNNFQKEEQPKTYSEQLDQLKCTCPAGAQIRPSSLPSATIDLGDIIADHTRILSTFTSAYGVVTVVLKMVACIIDVLCCLVNPFCIIFAIIRLFGTCIPDFILIFPQFALPAIIICLVKIILAIVEYILEVLLPIILDIIQNIQDLIDAFNDDNQDAVEAVGFKLAALIKELYNILGILAVLNGIWVMVKALLSAGIGIPCGGSGGSCSECGGDEICPEILQQTSFSGTDGQFVILFGSNGFSFQILFYSSSHKLDFIQMRNFFPRGLDYAEVKNEEDVPYILNITQSSGAVQKYVVTSVDSSGYSTLYQLPPEYISDGYLSSTDINNVPLTDPLEARFNTKTETFTSSSVGSYVTMSDIRGISQSQINGGSWKIQNYYDGYNVLFKRSSDVWSYGAPSEHLRWKLEPSVPSITNNLNFELEINHEELLRHGLINVGCHPAVKATREALVNRFPDMEATLPDLPDFDSLVNNISECIGKVAPIDVDTEYVLNNYQTIATEITGLYDCVSDQLNGFKNDAIDYAKEIYPVLVDPETSEFDVEPRIQIIGLDANIQAIPYDRNGGLLGVTVPPGIVEIDFETNFGSVGEVIENNTTGQYISTITSFTPGIANIKAKIGGRYISYFNGNNLIPKEVSVEFITSEEARRRSLAITGEVSTEPVGRSK